MEKFIIGIDVDGTTLNLMKVLLEIYNIDFNDNLQEKDIVHWNITDLVKPEAKDKIHLYFEDPNLYYAVEPYEYALEAVKFLKLLGHRVFFHTHSTVGASGAKYRKLLELGFLDCHDDYMEVKDKSLISADYIIDDAIHNIKAFRSGVSILMDREWNKNENHTFRVKDWKHVVDLFRITAERNRA